MIASQVKAKALELGFDLVGVADARDAAYGRAFLHYQAWIERGLAADMSYLARHSVKKKNPEEFLKNARSVVVVGSLYAAPVSANASALKISNYAQGPDYHEVLEKKLELLIAQTQSAHAGECRPFVDRHPVMDRAWARLAGLGWLGKNTCLIHRKHGSYFFIGGFFSTLEMQADAPTPEHCGRCRLCIDACPTSAILEPGQTGLSRHVVDSNKCISYHTIENRGEIPSAITSQMQGWVVGCDICQSVCPWNNPRNAQSPPSEWFSRKNELAKMPAEEAAALTESEWQKQVRGTAISRLKYTQFQRNLKIAKTLK